MRTRRIAASLAATVVAMTTVVSAAQAAPHHDPRPGGSGASAGHGARFDHLFVIMLENHSQSSVIDDPNAPFITQLAHTYSMADHYYGVTHPSMPNYIATIAGDTFGIQDDKDQNVVNLDRPNLVDQLEAHHVSWDAYMETLPADKLASFQPRAARSPLYAKKHNPFVLFDDVKNDPARMSKSVTTASCRPTSTSRTHPSSSGSRPTSATTCTAASTARSPGTPRPPARYGSTKDDANDAALKQKADDFVQRGRPRRSGSSRAWTRRSAIVVVTDENDYTGNAETGGWEDATGCCDSPYVPAGRPPGQPRRGPAAPTAVG